MFLSARVIDGRFLSCWQSGGFHKNVDPGIWPHFWSLYKREGSIPLWKRLLSDIRKKIQLWRLDVDDVRFISGLRDDESLEANIPFVQLLTIERGFTHSTDEPTHAAWDTEFVTGGQFPSFKRDPITELSWYSPSHEEVLQGDEVAIIEGFCDLCKREDPDLSDTYNGHRFDWRGLRDRARANKMRLPVGRMEDAPYIRATQRRWGKFRGYDYQVFLEGRLSFDVYNEARQDTSLTGNVKNRALKTVAMHMFPDEDFIIVDRARLGDLTAGERRDYCLSDARATWMLADHYLGIIKMLARELRAPLDLILRRSPSHIGNYVYGRAFKEIDVVSDGANFERFRGLLWDE